VAHHHLWALETLAIAHQRKGHEGCPHPQSWIAKSVKVVGTESEERRRRERRKEREDRHRREKEKIRTGGRSKKPQGLDIIDKLDVTGIYGQGRKLTDMSACNANTDRTQSSITMGHSTLATLTATQRKTNARLWKRSLPTQQTWLSEAPDL
jgi:hypothetical protein